MQVLPKERAEQLHQPFVGDLTENEARVVGIALKERLLPTLLDGERLLLDGKRTTSLTLARSIEAPRTGTRTTAPTEGSCRDSSGVARPALDSGFVDTQGDR